MKQRLAFALLMGIVTTGIISFALIAINLGLGPAFVVTWLRAWATAYLVVIPIILLIAPRVQAAVDRRFARMGAVANVALKQRLTFALCMGIITTCIISFALIAVNVGFGPNFVRLWLQSWALAYLAVIPAILFIAPRVQALVASRFKAPAGP